MEQHVGAPVLRKFEAKKKGGNGLVLGAISIFVVLLGIGTGWLFSGKKLSDSPAVVPGSGTTATENEAGVKDASAFTDTAEGELLEGGISGEGTHHLEREGGPSKNVYLTSTIINMDNFVGKKVTVWGQTTSGQKAGWLMDVGKIKVIQ